MLRDNDIQIHIGRASHGGDFMRLVHVPTGITRGHPGPMKSVNCSELQRQWLQEIEEELLRSGLTQYIVPPYRQKNRRQKPK
jgi:hypothetical protein